MALSELDMKLIIPGRDTLRRIYDKLRGAAAVAGSEIMAISYCLHGPDDGCVCRKSQPGLLQGYAPNPGCA